jgi:hypothetical protein
MFSIPQSSVKSNLGEAFRLSNRQVRGNPYHLVGAEVIRALRRSITVPVGSWNETPGTLTFGLGSQTHHEKQHPGKEDQREHDVGSIALSGALQMKQLRCR